MKRLSFAIMLALCTMGVWAQEGIKVNKWNKGVKTQTTLKWNGHGFDK